MRFQDTDNAPMIRGLAGNGLWMESATPLHTNCSVFCIVIQAPIMTSIVVSMSAARSLLSNSISMVAPRAAPHDRHRKRQEEVHPQQHHEGVHAISAEGIELTMREI